MSLDQCERTSSALSPRLTMMLAYLRSPTSFHAVGGLSVPSRYSMRSPSAVSREHSLNAAAVRVSNSSLNLNGGNGSSFSPVEWLTLLLRLRGCGKPADPDDDELRRLERCDTDLADQTAVVDVRLRHSGANAFDEEGLPRDAEGQQVLGVRQ